jgi:glutamate racemase
MAETSSLPVDVGVFDSGVGGLTVLREIRALLPHERLFYVADSKHVPYGAKPAPFIRERARAIVRHLTRDRGARVVVVACNTATTHAVDALRTEFPDVSIVGMEPAIKPAARATRSGVVAVLATGATLEGERVASLIERNADGLDVLTQACPGLVECVEAGDLAGPRTVDLLRRYTEPLLGRGADTIVLGCTHYPFLRGTLEQIVGPSVTIIDSGAAVARQTLKVLGRPRQGGGGSVSFATSADPLRVKAVIERLWGAPPVEVECLPAGA